MSMFNDIVWREENEGTCLANSTRVLKSCLQVRSRTLVISRSRFRNRVEFNRHYQAWRRMGQGCKTHDRQVQRGWSFHIPSQQRIGPRSIEEQRKWEIVYSYLCG